MTRDDFTVVPDASAGDPFLAASRERPCICYSGWVYVGHIVEGEDGSEREVFERVACRKCSEEGQ